VVIKQIDGVAHEPYEQVTVDADSDAQGDIMQALGSRGAELKDMQADGRGRVRLDYMIPSRGLIGFQTEFRTMTRAPGCCTMYSITTGRSCRVTSASGRMAC